MFRKIIAFFQNRKKDKLLLPIRGRTEGFPIKSTPVFFGMGGAVLEAHTELVAEHIRKGKIIARHTVLNRCVTVAGRDAIVNAFYGTFDLSTFNYHDCGTGTKEESVDDTGLQTPVPEARVAGTKSKPNNYTYKSVAVITFTGTRTITEHCLFNQLAKSSGVALDRTVHPAINVLEDDSIQYSFTISFAAGG